MTQASKALTPQDDGAADAMAYLDSLAAAPSKPETPEVADAPEEQVEEAALSEESSVDEPEALANPEGEPEAESESVDDSVYEAFSDDIRADLKGSNLKPETIKKLSSSTLMQADYTRKTQAVSEKDRRIEAERQKAESWDQLMADPRALQMLANLDTVSEDEEFDFLGADAKDVDKHIDQRVERRLQAQEQAAREQKQAVESWKMDVGTALAPLQVESGLDAEAWQEATNLLADQLEAAGIDPLTHINAANIRTFMEPHVNTLRYRNHLAQQKASADKSKSDVTRSQRASSPSPKRVAASRDVNKWEAEGRHATKEELRDLTMRQFHDAGIDLNNLPGG